MFCGVGSLTLGALEACRALRFAAKVVLAVDDHEPCTSVYRRWLPQSAQAIETADIASLVDNHLGARVTAVERALLDKAGRIDLLLAGPPCQGHSALNNHSRHDDDRNDLYARAVRLVEIAEPEVAIIENVVGVTSDRRGALERGLARLRSVGYEVRSGMVDLSRLGVPQTRRRHVLLAWQDAARAKDPSLIAAQWAVPGPRSVGWAIGDLVASEDLDGGWDEASRPSDRNKQRMAWLHAKPGRFDLPDSLRPPCHRTAHTYRSMYGKLDWDRPAQTITSGYGSMGQGRYVHPRHPRTLTPHEAARLQLLPDFLKLSAAGSRKEWSRMIGNAAPWKLSYAVLLDALR